MFKTKLLFFLTIVLFTTCEKAVVVAPSVYSCTLSFPDGSQQHPKANQFEDIIRQMGERLPGVNVSIKTTDGNTWNGAAGMADIPNNVPLEPCHRTMIGSISKIFTATAIFRLQDAGLLSIDDPLTDWVEEDITSKLANADQATIRQLLQHTSGIPEYLAPRFHFDRLNTSSLRLTPREKLAYAYGKSAATDLDGPYSYSNSNYVLLGLVIEAASNQPLDEAMETYIFSPLGLASARHGTSEMPIPEGTARPYFSPGGSRFFDATGIDSGDAATGDGGVAINMQELVFFIESLVEGRFLSASSLTEMTANLIPAGDGARSGLGLFQIDLNGRSPWQFSGEIQAYNADMFYFPEEKVSLCIGFNSVSTNNRIEDEVTELLEELIEALF